MRKALILLIGLLILKFSFAQNSIDVYPTNWWVGMKNPRLQLMLHGKGIGAAHSVSIPYPGITVLKTHQPENQNYLFVDLAIASNTKPGTAIIKLNTGQSVSFAFK